MGILDNAKAVAEGIQLAANVQLFQQFMKLHVDIMDMLTENRNLHEEKESLKAKLELKAKMEFKAPFYYQAGDEIPFCQRCFEADNKAIHLNVLHNGRWQCKACNNAYGKENPPRRHVIHPGYGPGEPDGWMNR